MTDISAWLTSKGFSPLKPKTALPAVSSTSLSPPRHLNEGRNGRVSKNTRPTTVVGNDLFTASLSIPIPNESVLSLAPIILTTNSTEDLSLWRAIKSTDATIAAIAVTWTHDGSATHGLWLPATSTYGFPSDIANLCHWTGDACPDQIARLIGSGIPAIGTPVVVARQAFHLLRWPPPMRWMDGIVQLRAANMAGDLDEVAAWLCNSTDASRWAAMRFFSGVISRDQPFARAIRQALTLTRIQLGISARCGTTLGTSGEEEAWVVDQTINERGLPVDARLIKRIIASADSPHIVAKFAEVHDCCCNDGRVRGAYQYLSQHTGRWSASEPALHNLRRTVATEAEITSAIDSLNAGDSIHPSLQSRIFGSLERPMFLAPPGMTFVVGDQKQAEPRGVFYFAGLFDVLRGMDSSDLYLEPRFQTVLFGDAVTPDHPDAKRRRMVLKIVVIACGFGMGPDKLAQYALDSFGFDFAHASVDPERAVCVYRDLFRPIPTLWGKLGKLSLEAVRSLRPIDTEIGRLLYSKGDFRIELRSGRTITYPRAAVVDGPYGSVIEYWKGGPLRGKRITAWGGVLFQHAVTGTLRDIQAYHLVELERIGLDPVGHTHDEIVCLVHEQECSHAIEVMSAVMGRAPDFVPNLNLTCKPYATKRLGAEALQR